MPGMNSWEDYLRSTSIMATSPTRWETCCSALILSLGQRFESYAECQCDYSPQYINQCLTPPRKFEERKELGHPNWEKGWHNDGHVLIPLEGSSRGALRGLTILESSFHRFFRACIHDDSGQGSGLPLDLASASKRGGSGEDEQAIGEPSCHVLATDRVRQLGTPTSGVSTMNRWTCTFGVPLNREEYRDLKAIASRLILASLLTIGHETPCSRRVNEQSHHCGVEAQSHRRSCQA